MQKVLSLIADNLDKILRNQFSLDENIVVLNNLIDINGMEPQKNQNKIVLTFFNLSEENNLKNNKPIGAGKLNQNNNNNISFNLLLTANFDDYAEALKILDAARLYFNKTPIFNTASFPQLLPELEKISVTLVSTTLEELQIIWALMGVNYKPSVVYKVNTLNKVII